VALLELSDRSLPLDPAIASSMEAPLIAGVE
jgi:hypothetical protein